MLTSDVTDTEEVHGDRAFASGICLQRAAVFSIQVGCWVFQGGQRRGIPSTRHPGHHSIRPDADERHPDVQAVLARPALCPDPGRPHPDVRVGRRRG